MRELKALIEFGEKAERRVRVTLAAEAAKRAAQKLPR